MFDRRKHLPMIEFVRRVLLSVLLFLLILQVLLDPSCASLSELWRTYGR
jgi:hypothetical protein